jgi:uncharacterized protein (DUF1499 family)
MRWILIALVVAVVGYLALLGALGVRSRRTRPAPELADGRLRPCPRPTNCACSEDVGRSGTAPLPFEGDADGAWRDLARAVVATGGVIDGDREGHLHARYVSSFFGFVDDFEARLDAPNRLIHLRSASRVGYADRGVNRRRLRAVREHFAGSRSPG